MCWFPVSVSVSGHLDRTIQENRAAASDVLTGEFDVDVLGERFNLLCSDLHPGVIHICEPVVGGSWGLCLRALPCVGWSLLGILGIPQHNLLPLKTLLVLEVGGVQGEAEQRTQVLCGETGWIVCGRLEVVSLLL